MADGNKQQIPLFRGQATPDELITHWRRYATCKLCGQFVRHEMHLHNHYNRYHVLRDLPKDAVSFVDEKKPQRHYAYIGEKWIEVSILQYLYARTIGIPTAFTKR